MMVDILHKLRFCDIQYFCVSIWGEKVLKGFLFIVLLI